jgi:hypothetical protein
VSTRVSLICAGWLPQDGTSSRSWPAGLAASVVTLWGNVIAHSRGAGHSKTLADTREVHLDDFRTGSVVEYGQ